MTTALEWLRELVEAEEWHDLTFEMFENGQLDALLDLAEASLWLGAHPEGYCYCFGAKQDLPEGEHTGECRDMRNALKPLLEELEDE